MNVQVKLEKKQLECSEGLNHLLINIDHISRIEDFQLNLLLPKGISALQNLNNFPENDQYKVTIPEIHEDTNVTFELFTEGTIPLGELFITVTLSYILHGQLFECQKHVPLMIVSEEMSDQIIPDPEVVSRVAKLKSDCKQEWEQHSFVILPVIQESEYKLSPLEKRYRIQGSCEAF